MSSSELAASETSDAPSDLVCVGTYDSFAAGSERGLVALAFGFSYWLVPAETGYALLVEPGAESLVREQLRRFERESIGWPPLPAPPTTRIRDIDIALALGWALVVIAAFWAQNTFPHLTARGALDPAAVFSHHEWWRIVTALFLHADAGHLVSNLLSGIFIFAAVTSVLSAVRGWMLIMLGAILGNLLSIVGAGATGYTSIGASTAVFAGLGLLTGRAIVAASRTPARRGAVMFGPAAGGVIVLALYGAGGQRVDIGAHVCGFAAGLLLGVVNELRRAAR